MLFEKCSFGRRSINRVCRCVGHLQVLEELVEVIVVVSGQGFPIRVKCQLPLVERMLVGLILGWNFTRPNQLPEFLEPQRHDKYLDQEGNLYLGRVLSHRLLKLLRGWQVPGGNPDSTDHTARNAIGVEDVDLVWVFGL
jgi:hypothetical protein